MRRDRRTAIGETLSAQRMAERALMKLAAGVARAQERALSTILPRFDALDRRGWDTLGRIDRLGTHLSAIEAHLRGIETHVAALENRVQDLARNQELVDARVSAVAAQGWDRQAVIRRLAALEDAIAEPEGREAAPQ